MEEQTYHVPVLLNESIEGMDLRPGGIYVDVTFGGGGHSKEILRQGDDSIRLLSFDQDEDAVKRAFEDPRFTIVYSNFRFLSNFLRYYNVDGVDGILADLGVSFHHFDDKDRGFSFRFEGPLDMRMNVQGGKTAADILNSYTQEELEKVLKIYGEVDNAHRLASLIVAARAKAAILTTDDLTNAIAAALPPFAEHKFLAKVYQALRIEVNDEMRSLEKFLSGASASLKQGGRLVVITYHSLEDRMVKNFIKCGNIEGRECKDTFGRLIAPLKAVNRKPIVPSDEEIESNTRARSAKLRIAEKL